MYDHRNKIRTAYTIKLNGCINIDFPDVSTYTFTYVIAYFYDDSLNYLSYQERSSEDYYKFLVPVNAEYVRFVFQDMALTDSIPIQFFSSIVSPYECKNAKTRTDTEWITMDVQDDMFTFGRLLLPPNYTIDGKKTPLVLWMDGSGNTTTWDSDFNTEKLQYLRYVRDEGFAVLLVFGWGSYFYEKYSHCGRAYPYQTPTGIACIKAGIEWVCDRYNIDENEIHVMSKSQGGQFAFYLATNPIVPIKSIGMFAPVLDYLSMPGEAFYEDTRKAIAEDLNLQGDSSYFISGEYSTYTEEAVAFLEANIEAICGLNEAWTGLIGNTLQTNFESSIADGNKFWSEQYWTTPAKTDIYDDITKSKVAHVPVKIWGASDDDNTPYLKMVEAVKQLQNGGTEAVMRTFNRGTGGHSCADVGNTISSVTTALGVTYTNLPAGWNENVTWIRQHMAK